MKYATLGETGLVVSRISLGTWTFSIGQGAYASVSKVDQTAGERLVGEALDAGVNLFDTADRYGAGEAEIILGAAVRSRRHEAVIVTKAGLRAGDGLLQTGLSRRHLLDAAEQSLKRLNTDFIDVYLAHREDEYTPLEETLVALDEIVRSGKTRYIGFSNWPAWKVAAALEFQKANGLARFTHGQMYYSLVGRDIEDEYLTMSARYGLGLTVWSALAMGLLSGKYTAESVHAEGTRFSELGILPLDFDRALAVVAGLKVVAARVGATPAQTALAWLLAKPAVSSIVAGVSNPQQLAENLKAVDLELDAGAVAELDALSATPARYPAWHIASVRDKATEAALGPPTFRGV